MIELLDINDNSPEADDIMRREVLRSSNIGHVIVDVIHATDKDSGVNALLNFGTNLYQTVFTEKSISNYF
jgi:hypothetical protein